MPRVGDKRTVNGRIQTWDGTRWTTTGTAPTGPAPPPPPTPGIDPQVVIRLKQALAVGADPLELFGESFVWTPDEMQQAISELQSEEAATEAGKTPSWRPGERAIEQSKVEAANMATYLDSVIRGVETEIAAGRLTLDQAEAEFNRRMDALSEAGTQMAALWQWTVPEGAGTLHPDLRENLGMEPWESQPVPWDPYGEALKIIGETPELTGPSISTDPIQEAIERAQGLV